MKPNSLPCTALLCVFLLAISTQASGRFLSPDPEPADEQNFNRYWYANNNPYTFVDPDGQFGHRANVPWHDVGGQVGNWFAKTRDFHADAAFGSYAAGRGALQESYDQAFNAVLITATLGMSGASPAGSVAPLRGGPAAMEAGSIRGVNAIGGKMNCVNCSIATDATLAGRPASALGGGPFRIDVLEKTFGGRFGAPGPIGSVSEAMSAAGSGARGIVFGSRGGGEPGHVFNAVNQNGVIRFLDGQTGRAASLKGYESFQLLRTN